jgi:serine beta-lactamase-like protein LACTB
MAALASRRQVLAGTSAAIAAAPMMPTTASEPTPSVTKASRYAHELFAAKPAPALSMAVARGDGVIWAEALGTANLEHGVPATVAHTFPLGSVSKVITSTAAARLVTRGALDIDAPISLYLPDLPAHHQATTMRQLLTHRGGVRHYLPHDFDIQGPGGAVYMRSYPTNDTIRSLFIDDPLIAAPGTSVNYSSYGYTLASMVMEAAAGMPFLDLIDAEIVRPLALESFAAEDPWAIIPHRAGRYMNAFDVGILYGSLPEAARPRLTDGWANLPLSNPAYCWAGAGFLMAPSDTARFGAALLNGALTSTERALLFIPMTESTQSSPPLGLGWRIDKDAKERPRWHHAGSTPGGRYMLVLYPDLGLSVAIAGNVMAMPLDAAKAASDLADLFT